MHECLYLEKEREHCQKVLQKTAAVGSLLFTLYIHVCVKALSDCTEAAVISKYFLHVDNRMPSLKANLKYFQIMMVEN